MRRVRLTLVVLLLSALAVPVLVVAPPAVGAPAAAVLKPGSQGREVKTVQRALGLRADGVYGPATARAVKRFQRRNGLKATGRVDAATRRALTAADPTSTGGSTAEETAQPVGPAPAASSIVEAAASALGVRYAAGGASLDGFDCSGLVVWSASAVGLKLPRSSFEQFKTGSAVDKDAILAGDLVFFNTAGPGASDVGVATSASTVISATTHGVREHAIFGDYWGEHFVGARRVK